MRKGLCLSSNNDMGLQSGFPAQPQSAGGGDIHGEGTVHSPFPLGAQQTGSPGHIRGVPSFADADQVPRMGIVLSTPPVVGKKRARLFSFASVSASSVMRSSANI